MALSGGAGKGPKGARGPGGGKKSGGGPSGTGDRDNGTRAGVGTGNGAHDPKGNQAGKDAKGNKVGREDGRSAVHTATGNPVSEGITVQRTDQAQDNLDNAVADHNDTDLGDIIAGMIGLGSIDPTTDPDFNAATMDAPNSSFDALGAAVGLGLGALGVPLVGGPLVTGLKAVGALPDDLGEINVGQLGSEAEETGFGSLPDGTTVDSAVDTGDPDADTGGAPDSDGGSRGADDPFPSVAPKPAAGDTPDIADEEDEPFVLPQSGVGIDLVTQTNTVQNGGGVTVPDASKRRRRGTLGGLGLGGLAI